MVVVGVGRGASIPSPPAKKLLILPPPRIFFLISYSLDTYVMLILILIDVRYLQKAVFSFQKGSNHQNYFSSGSPHTVKTPPCPLPPSKISNSPPLNKLLVLFGKPWSWKTRKSRFQTFLVLSNLTGFLYFVPNTLPEFLV